MKTAAQNHLLNFCQIINPKYEAVWFHDLIARKLEEALEKVVKKEKARIILTLPPRHGKSQLSSIYFPAWALGKYPEMKFIFATYGADLAEKMGLATRDVINDPGYQAIFPGISLRQDVKAKAKWMTNKKGSYTAVGTGGAITGSGGNCVTGDTVVPTEHGDMTIADIVQLRYTGRVLSYNHETNVLEWKRVLAVADNGEQEVTEIQTIQGGVLRATDEHRIFSDSIYRRTTDIQPGSKLVTLQEKHILSFLQKIYTKIKSKCSLSGLLVQGQDNNLRVRVFSLWKEIFSPSLRSRKINQTREPRFLLFKRMFKQTPFFQEPSSVCNLSHQTYPQKDHKILQCRMSSILQKTIGHKLQNVWKIFCYSFHQENILFQGLSKQISLNKNDWNREFPLQKWDELQFRIRENETNYQGKRWSLCRLWEFKFKEGSDSPSYRSQSTEQSSYKSNNSLRSLSHDTPQIKTDTVSMVRRLHSKERVYDIQVEDNNNFFANGVLVHNCIICDDLIKSRDEAESETMQDFVRDYYRSTLYSRLEGYGAVIIIMQRWNQKDIVAWLLEEDERRKLAGDSPEEWEVINFPAIAEEDEYLEGKLIRREGEALWPNKFPIPVLENIKATSGLFNFVSQYQQDPIATENQEFKERFFKYYEPEQLVGKYLRYHTLVDPAISQKKSADNTVVLTIAKEVNGPNWYRVREDAGHFTPSQTIELIFAHNAAYGSEVSIETVAFQMALKYSLIEEQRKRQKYFTIHEIKTQTNKETKIRGLLPLYEAGVIWHLKSDTELERELLSFPNGRRDDRIDCLAMGLLSVGNTRGSAAKQFKKKINGYFRNS